MAEMPRVVWEVPSSAALTIICDGYIISDKTEDERRSTHYELKWEIPDRTPEQFYQDWLKNSYTR